MSQLSYETMYILRPDIPEEELEGHVNKYRDLITAAGGEVIDTQMRGKRRLAYTISRHKEGVYVQLQHRGDGQHINQLEKQMRLSEDVIRYLTIKLEAAASPTSRTGGGEAEGGAAEVAAANA
ncbi:MAG: 30S ribosomal protein S6 [Aphanocapsa feldmannii 277cV]|uniref:Small ribosomal subunit protein bS6 n=2 Tax=Aphanocapsa feldmannii TaxID=192050 RepID=A0A524RP46_9CHRO|nr:MAG: 30S ribosomal protein S6 [Aphanocapsa feldmannii 288cV]TGG93133.1 MAG: 30S ribosomal protein S6 [Aphanocapsa feldmannii 277cV]TGH21571.1 MAG: 30S ribosomal protein S6 [Aphanocapsa feldmannii 277cI]